MTSTSGSRSPAASAMPRRASRSAAGPTSAADDALLAEHDRGLAAEPGQRQQRRRRLAPAGARQQHPLGRAVSQQVSDAGPVRPSRRLHRFPRRHVGHRFGRRVPGGGASGASATTFSARSSVGAAARAGRRRRSRRGAAGSPRSGRPAGTARRRGARRPAGRGSRSARPGSATVTWPSEPHDANTPPVVGWRR